MKKWGIPPSSKKNAAPEITLLDEHNATGIWAMEDLVHMPRIALQGWGHYHERYRKEDGVWRIAEIRLTRVRLIMNGEEQDIPALST